MPIRLYLKEELNIKANININIDLNNYLAKPDKTIKQHNDELIEQLKILRNLGYIKSDNLYNSMIKVCIYHDIGKVNPKFQERVKTNGRIKFDSDKEIYHNILSLCFIDKNDFDDIEDFYSVAHAVLQHHNYGNVFDIINDNGDLINELLMPFNFSKVKRSLLNKLSEEESVTNTKSILIKGLLHKCDYSASAGYQIEYKNDFLLDSLENLKYKWNDVQKFCIDNRDNNIIVVASTGAGKTEAGLLWQGNNKSFFILPIRTAINAMYDRIKDNILNNINIDKRLSILHSSSLDYYNKNRKLDSVENIGDIDFIEYENRGKRLSIPLNISTMDQLFDFVYKYNGYELKLATLSYSKVVIDEIQMYDSDLLAYLIYGIDKIIEVGGKVSILTATFPPFIYDLLDKDKTRFVKKDFVPDKTQKPRHNIKVIDSDLNAQDIVDKFNYNKKNNLSNKILVVCNTIKKAQQIYQQLDDLNIFEKKELNILHSQFIKKERRDKEKQISLCGKTYNGNEIDKRNCIWISTSLVEVSLDIDFDYLFTELQDLNSLFQRFGRVNRKGIKDNNLYNCFVYTNINQGALKCATNSHGFIDKVMFELSKQAISLIDGLITEGDKVNLINRFLTTEKLRESSYLNDFHETYNYIKNITPYSIEGNEVKLRNIMNEGVIPSPVYFVNKDEIDNLVHEYNNCLSDIKMLKKSSTSHVNKENYITDLRKSELRKNLINSAINDYTVDIPSYYTYNNCLLMKTFDDKHKIKVIECGYGEKGFIKKGSDNSIEEANII